MKMIDKTTFRDYELVSKILKYWALSSNNRITLTNQFGAHITFYMNDNGEIRRIVQLRNEPIEDAIESNAGLSIDELLIIAHNVHYLPADVFQKYNTKAEEIIALSTAYTQCYSA